MEIEAAVERYLDDRIGTLRPQTWAKHRMTLNRFKSWFSGELEAVTTDGLREWRGVLNVQPQSANKYMDRVKALFDHAVKHEWIVRGPVWPDPLDEDPPDPPRLEPHVFSQMLDEARHPRDRAMIATALELLLRGGELAALKVGQVDLDRRIIKVRVSKMKGRLVWDEMAISDALVEEVGRWLRAYRREAGMVAAADYLFPQLRTVRRGVDNHVVLIPSARIAHPYRIVGHALRAIGHDSEAVGFHTIRRSAARALYDVLADGGHDRALAHVSSLMHHRNRQTTELYLGTSGDREARNKIIRETGLSVLSMADPAKSHPVVLSLPDVSVPHSD